MSYFKETPCGHCKKPIRYSDSQLGTTVRCPKCGNSVTLGLPAVPGAQNPQAHIDKPNRPVGAPVSAKGKPGWVKDVKDLAGVVPPTPTGRTEVFETAKPAGKVSNDAWADPNATGVPPLPSSPPPGNYTLVRRVAIGLSAAAMIGLLATGTWWFKTSAAGTGQMQTQSGPAKTVGGDAQQPPAGGAQPQTPTAPQTPPPSTPSTPPGQPEPPPTPPQDQNALDPKRKVSEQVEVENGIESTVFASSILGMREFDDRFLKTLTRDECYNKMVRELADLNHNDKIDEDVPEEVRRILSIAYAIRDQGESGKSVFDSRPLFVAKFPSESLPQGVRVGVYVDVPLDGQRFLGCKPSDPVSASSSVPLCIDCGGGKRDFCDFNKENDCFEVPLDLRWNTDELLKLESPVHITLTVRVIYEKDGSIDSFPAAITLRPPSEVEGSYPCDFAYATLVNEAHPWIRRTIDTINQDPQLVRQGIKLTGGGSEDPEDQLMSAFQIWKFLAKRGMRYQSLNGADVGAQQVRQVHEAMGRANANCVDGAILFASFYQALGLRPCLVWAPGHAYVSFQYGKQRVYLETTCIGESFKELPSLKEFPLLAQNPKLKDDPAYKSFLHALLRGIEETESNEQELKKKVERYKELARLKNEKKEIDEAEFQKLFFNIANNSYAELNISALRGLGVKPIGVRSDVDRAATYPAAPKK